MGENTGLYTLLGTIIYLYTLCHLHHQHKQLNYLFIKLSSFFSDSSQFWHKIPHLTDREIRNSTPSGRLSMSMTAKIGMRFD